MKRLLTAMLIIFLLSDCVPNRKIQYVQKDDVNLTGNEVKRDTILREYDVVDFQYRLQEEDMITIRFQSLTNNEYDFFSLKSTSGGGGTGNNRGLANGYLIDENGDVEFPVVGKIKVAGLTIFEAQNKIQQIASKYLESVVVEIRLLNFRFTILGDVGVQGVFSSTNNRTSILEALGMAGGLSDLADRRNVKILRQTGDRVSVYYLDLLDEDLVHSPFFYMHQNDVVVVPPLKQRPFRVYWTQNLGIFVSTLTVVLLVVSLLTGTR